MTTTARIAATKGAGTYTASIAAGSVGNFAATGMGPNESIKLLGADSSGAYAQLIYIDQGGSSRTASLDRNNNTIQLTGPLDFRFEKNNTSSLVELSEFS